MANSIPKTLGVPEGEKSNPAAAATTENPPDSPPRWSWAKVSAAATGRPYQKSQESPYFEGVEPMGTVGTRHGKPCITFSAQEVDILMEPYKFALIGKFSDGNPRRRVFRRSFYHLGLKGIYHVSFYDYKYVILVLTDAEDYAKIWAIRDDLLFDGCPMEVVKYYPHFTADVESPVELVKWIKPSMKWVKLNTDGASKGVDPAPGRAGAGGLVRDHEGNVHFAFSCFLGKHTDIIFAKMLAVYKGLTLCIERGFHHVWIEVDSVEIIEFICSAKHTAVQLLDHLVQKVKELVEQLAFKITHICREGNRPADRLASLACETKQSRVCGPDEIAGPLSEMIQFDNMNA